MPSFQQQRKWQIGTFSSKGANEWFTVGQVKLGVVAKEIGKVTMAKLMGWHLADLMRLQWTTTKILTELLQPKEWKQSNWNYKMIFQKQWNYFWCREKGSRSKSLISRDISQATSQLVIFSAHLKGPQSYNLQAQLTCPNLIVISNAWGLFPIIFNFKGLFTPFLREILQLIL